MPFEPTVEMFTKFLDALDDAKRARGNSENSKDALNEAIGTVISKNSPFPENERRIFGAMLFVYLFEAVLNEGVANKKAPLFQGDDKNLKIKKELLLNFQHVARICKLNEMHPIFMNCYCLPTAEIFEAVQKELAHAKEVWQADRIKEQKYGEAETDRVREKLMGVKQGEVLKPKAKNNNTKNPPANASALKKAEKTTRTKEKREQVSPENTVTTPPKTNGDPKPQISAGKEKSSSPKKKKVQYGRFPIIREEGSPLQKAAKAFMLSSVIIKELHKRVFTEISHQETLDLSPSSIKKIFANVISSETGEKNAELRELESFYFLRMFGYKNLVNDELVNKYVEDSRVSSHLPLFIASFFFYLCEKASNERSAKAIDILNNYHKLAMLSPRMAEKLLYSSGPDNSSNESTEPPKLSSNEDENDNSSNESNEPPKLSSNEDENDNSSNESNEPPKLSSNEDENDNNSNESNEPAKNLHTLAAANLELFIISAYTEVIEESRGYDYRDLFLGYINEESLDQNKCILLKIMLAKAEELPFLLEILELAIPKGLHDDIDLERCNQELIEGLSIAAERNQQFRKHFEAKLKIKANTEARVRLINHYCNMFEFKAEGAQAEADNEKNIIAIGKKIEDQIDNVDLLKPILHQALRKEVNKLIINFQAMVTLFRIAQKNGELAKELDQLMGKRKVDVIETMTFACTEKFIADPGSKDAIANLTLFIGEGNGVGVLRKVKTQLKEALAVKTSDKLDSTDPQTRKRLAAEEQNIRSMIELAEKNLSNSFFYSFFYRYTFSARTETVIGLLLLLSPASQIVGIALLLDVGLARLSNLEKISDSFKIGGDATLLSTFFAAISCAFIGTEQVMLRLANALRERWGSAKNEADLMTSEEFKQHFKDAASGYYGPTIMYAMETIVNSAIGLVVAVIDTAIINPVTGIFNTISKAISGPATQEQKNPPNQENDPNKSNSQENKAVKQASAGVEACDKQATPPADKPGPHTARLLGARETTVTAQR